MVMGDFEGEVEVAVIIKAAPEIGRVHGETVCVAGIDRYGRWHRLYPVPFKDLTQAQRFGRWDLIKVRWRRPKSDERVESKRIDPQTLKIIGKLPKRERPDFVARALAESLDNEEASGRSLALIRPEKPRLTLRTLSVAELEKSQRRRNELHAQPDMFADTQVPKEAPPYSFSFEFTHAGRKRTHQCLDWETEWTFFKWRKSYGEATALQMMKEKWGSFDQQGLVFAMGTHRVKFWKSWLLSGLLRVQEVKQDQFPL